jgi:hypothetical protein
MKLLFWYFLLAANSLATYSNLATTNEVHIVGWIFNSIGLTLSFTMIVILHIKRSEESDGVNTKYTTETGKVPKKIITKKAKDPFARFEATIKQTRKERGQAAEN